jgi:hypothetical protein
MLNKIKKRAYKFIYKYHRYAADYCHRKSDSCRQNFSGYWVDRMVKHVREEFKMVAKLRQMEEIKY